MSPTTITRKAAGSRSPPGQCTVPTVRCAEDSPYATISPISRRSHERLERLAAFLGDQANLLDLAHDAIVVLDMQGKITFWNKGAERMYGWTSEEACGNTEHDLLLTKCGIPVERMMELVIRDGYWEGELDQTTKSGNTVTVASRWSLKRDHEGRPNQILELNTDMSERKRAEAALHRAGAYNRRLIEASLDPLVTIGADGRITDVNSATEKVTGCERTELVGKDFTDYFTEPDLARAGYQRVFREGLVRDYPLKIRHRDGHVTPVLYNAAVYRDEAGAVGGAFASARDLTELRSAEARQTRLLCLIDLARDAIFVRAEVGTISFWNKGAERMYGWSKAEAIGRLSHDLLKTQFPEPPAEIVAEVRRKGSWEGELIHTCAGGRTIVVISRWVLDRDNIMGSAEADILEINSDITDRRRAEHESHELRGQLEQRVRDRTMQLEATNNELEAFCYAVSHDLRAPLRGIDGFTQALVEDYAPNLDEQGRHWCQRIRSAAQRMAQIIDDLLRLSRTTRGQLNVGPVDMSAIAQKSPTASAQPTPSDGWSSSSRRDSSSPAMAISSSLPSKTCSATPGSSRISTSGPGSSSGPLCSRVAASFSSATTGPVSTWSRRTSCSTPSSATTARQSFLAAASAWLPSSELFTATLVGSGRRPPWSGERRSTSPSARRPNTWKASFLQTLAKPALTAGHRPSPAILRTCVSVSQVP